MLYSSLFLLSAFELLAQATESYPQSSTPAWKRQVMSCEQTYGNGSIPCGSEETTKCYNPGLGQTCCELDGGFCNAGSYCAPVKGYCCLEDEDLGGCAKRAGFVLPPDSAANDRAVYPDPAATTTPRISRTFTVTPFLTANPGPTPYSTQSYGTKPFEDAKMEFVTEFTMQIGSACRETTPALPSVSAVVQIANASVTTLYQASHAPPSVPTSASVSPIIQVSMAAKKKEALIGSICVIAVAGALTVLL
ncbi:hypothetical protein F5Y08DRAFT_335535 [Xylaria arbuscula]|nr:hypothetical protein F5Y08DRAFT_335535 [Xylaria arbuscula]